MCSLQVPLLFWMVFTKVAVSFKMMTCTLSHGPICGLVIWFIDSTNQFFFVCVCICVGFQWLFGIIWCALHVLRCLSRFFWISDSIVLFVTFLCRSVVTVYLFVSFFSLSLSLLKPCTRSQRSHHVYDCPTAIAIFTNWIWRHIGGYMGYENITNEIEN